MYQTSNWSSCGKDVAFRRRDKRRSDARGFQFSRMIDESSSSPVIRPCPTRGVRRQTSSTKGDTVNIHVVNRRTSMRWATMLGCRGRCRDRNAEHDCDCKRDLCHEHTSSLSPGGRLNAPTAEDPLVAWIIPVSVSQCLRIEKQPTKKGANAKPLHRNALSSTRSWTFDRLLGDWLRLYLL
jgi:hypothetical protein